MSFDWSDYLVVAQELAHQVSAPSTYPNTIKARLLYIITQAFHKKPDYVLDEAKLRCAISRAYYGAFRKARNHLRDKDGLPINVLTQGNTHQNVINQFSNSSDIDRQIIGQFLRDLRAARNKADYDDSVPNLSGLTTTVLLEAEQVMDLLKTI